MRIPKPKRTKNPIPRLRRQADSLLVRYLKPKCECCGAKALQLHHFFPKGSYLFLRYYEPNLVSLCMKCHFILTHRGDPIIEQAIIKNRGQKWYDLLEEKAKQRPNKTITSKWYRERINGLSN